ncbi:MAG: competence/damage-inducible protein A [Halovenus sp.]
MEVALITVGDELLAGDTVNSNANWLATQLTERGVTVTRILSVPDDVATIADRVTAYSDTFDAVIVTGGIGGTPDDVTMEAVAEAFDREMVVREATLEDVQQTIAAYKEARPELDIELDVELEASIPEGSRPLLNDEGLAPGCVIENVYVLPGIPGELKAMFESVSEEFSGDSVSEFLYTVEPEANIIWALDDVMTQFDVVVGCYPDREKQHNRLKLTATDRESLEAATAWLLENVNASETPVSRDWDA